MDPMGVIHGRFQMLHKGHMEYLLAGLERCRYLLIGISNPDAATTRFTSANPHRSLPLSNPLTYFERFQMIQGALLEAGVARGQFDIVPFPINCPQLLFNYVPREAKYYMTIYDDWSLEKKATLESLGCHVEVMWQRSNAEKFTSGTEVRHRILEGLPWQELVPPFTYRYVTEHHIDQRLCAMAAQAKGDDPQ